MSFLYFQSRCYRQGRTTKKTQGLISAPAGSLRLPFKPAIRALEGPVGIVICGMAGAGIGFGKGQFIVDVCMIMAKGSAAYSTGAPGLLFTKPTFHCSISIDFFYCIYL